MLSADDIKRFKKKPVDTRLLGAEPIKTDIINLKEWKEENNVSVGGDDLAILLSSTEKDGYDLKVIVVTGDYATLYFKLK